MKIKILIATFVFTILNAQTYGLKKIVDLPSYAPDFSMIHNDVFVFHNSPTRWNNTTYVLDSNNSELKSFNTLILNVVPRNNGGALVKGGNEYLVVENFRDYLASTNYNSKILDTLVNHELEIAISDELFEVDQNDNAYIIYENLRRTDYSSDEFILKKVNLKTMQRSKNIFIHDEFGSIRAGNFLKSDAMSNELCFATDKYFMRVDSNLSVVSKVPYTKWKPWHTTLDQHSTIITVSNDSLFYLNKNLEILKYFKLDLKGSLSQVEVDSKDRVFLKLYNEGVYTLYQVDFNTIVTSTSEEVMSTNSFIIQISGSSFEVNPDYVSQVRLHNLLGQSEIFESAFFTSQLKGMVIFAIQLKTGQILHQKTFIYF